jgi:hypothetical protein
MYDCGSKVSGIISHRVTGANFTSEIQSRLLLPMHPDKHHRLRIEFTVLK